MKRITIRTDLMKKSNYAKKYNVSRPTLDKLIENGDIKVERIDGVDYIKIN